MTKGTSNSNIAVAVVAGAATVIASRFVWKRIKNHKETVKFMKDRQAKARSNA